MKEKPVIFNSEMVRAILSGRKTQTRQIMKVQPDDPQMGLRFISESSVAKEVGMYFWSVEGALKVRPRSKPFPCPFGSVGDRIWVRETWADVNYEDRTGVAYRADGKFRHLSEEDGDESDPNLEKYGFANWYPDLIGGTEGRWTPSIHMPRWASRITLEITGVRVERLQDISQEDAQSEGMELTGWRPSYSDPDGGGETMTPYDNYASWWESTYGSGSWSANPWVWVVEFRKLNHG